MLESMVAYFLRCPSSVFSHSFIQAFNFLSLLSLHYPILIFNPSIYSWEGTLASYFWEFTGSRLLQMLYTLLVLFVFNHNWSVQDCSQYSATILILIFKLSRGYLLAVFDPEVHMMLHCFPLLLPAQSWYHAGFVAVSLIIIWYSFLYVSDLVFFCLEAQEFIFLLKSRNLTGIYLSVGHPSCRWSDPPPS